MSVCPSDYLDAPVTEKGEFFMVLPPRTEDRSKYFSTKEEAIFGAHRQIQDGNFNRIIYRVEKIAEVSKAPVQVDIKEVYFEKQVQREQVNKKSKPWYRFWS